MSEHGADRHFLPCVHHQPVEGAVIEHLDLDCALFGVDDGNDVASLDGIAWMLQPLDERAGFHVGTQHRHAEFDHRASAPLVAARAAAAMAVTVGNAASSRCFGYGIGTSAEQTRTMGASSS
jgi:hypothetical protein